MTPTASGVSSPLCAGRKWHSDRRSGRKAIETVSSGETVERNYLRTVMFGLMTGPRADLFGRFNLAVEPSSC